MVVDTIEITVQGTLRWVRSWVQSPVKHSVGLLQAPRLQAASCRISVFVDAAAAEYWSLAGGLRLALDGIGRDTSVHYAAQSDIGESATACTDPFARFQYL